MVLKNKYVVGCLVQFYEIEMLPEYIASCKQMLEGIENPENVTFDFTIGLQEHFEKIDYEAFGEIFLGPIIRKFEKIISNFLNYNISVKDTEDEFYNIASYRRDLNYNYCNDVDFVLWGETDSLWPQQTLQIIEAVSEMKESVPKFVLSFATRVNWDPSWDKIRHPLFRNEKFTEDDSWVLGNEASEKAYMSLDRMNEINSQAKNIEFDVFSQPKADGSCLVISSELIKSGVNIPHALLHCGEDESFLRMAKLIMGNQFTQYHVKNILRVHNRRHPKKRMYVLGEDNPRGFCTAEKKGDWWLFLEKYSKENLENLEKQVKFRKIDEIINR